MWGSANDQGIAVGQEQAMRRLSASMARNVLLAALGAGIVCVVGAGVTAGTPGLAGAGIGAVVATVFGLLTPMLVRLTATAEPYVVMLASFTSMLTKSLILFGVLFTLGSAAGIDRSSLVVTVLLGLIVTTAGESWASYRLRVLVGELPPSSRA
ncbi:hypothetical protein WIS52_10250 [Pseudonocardia nematodicida]|uniref:ATP synthase protein I n=1 Tax=Pseudonocardia nematodicida TaxID=1206997 RepID=A0ABV1K8Q9_9PSEU